MQSLFCVRIFCRLDPGHFRAIKWLMKTLLLAFSLLFFAPSALADFGEIDLVVRESIQKFFSEYDREVDLSSITYEKELSENNSIITVETAVQAKQGFTGDWGLHYCTTQLKIQKPGSYLDLGSDCFYDTDR